MTIKEIFKLFGRTYESVLCLDGSDFPSSLFFDVSIPVIAADGAFGKLQKIGVIPCTVVGDFDSVDVDCIDCALTESVKIDEQNTCDFQKSISYLKEKNLVPTIVVGISGGFIDHFINNISVLSTFSGCAFADSGTAGIVLDEGENLELELPIFTKLSIFGAQMAVVSTSGLKWELSESKLEFFKYNSCFNRTLRKIVLIKVISGKVIVILHRN